MRNYINKINLSFLTCIICIAVIFSSCQPELCRGVDLNSPDGLECDPVSNKSNLLGLWKIDMSGYSYTLKVNQGNSSGTIEIVSTFGYNQLMYPLHINLEVKSSSKAVAVGDYYVPDENVMIESAVFTVNGDQCTLTFTELNYYYNISTDIIDQGYRIE